jgi:hypothetical protein
MISDQQGMSRAKPRGPQDHAANDTIIWHGDLERLVIGQATHKPNAAIGPLPISPAITAPSCRYLDIVPQDAVDARAAVEGHEAASGPAPVSEVAFQRFAADRRRWLCWRHRHELVLRRLWHW